MNKFKIFFRYTVTLGKMAALMTAVSAAAAVESYSEEKMAQFLEKFPQLNECSAEQREEALSFYLEAEKVKALLAEASQAIEASNEEQACEKVAEATAKLQQMAEEE